MINKILRCITGTNIRLQNFRYVMPTTYVYKDLKVLQFDDIYKYFLLKFIHFCIYERYDLFLEYFYNLIPNHNYPTRNIRIHLPNVRLDVEKHFTVFQACELINNIDESFLQNE